MGRSWVGVELGLFGAQLGKVASAKCSRLSSAHPPITS